MKVITTILDFPECGRPVILAAGCFDGVHCGHKKVILTAAQQAAECGGDAWIFTFNPHPAKALSPQSAPPLISAEPCRIRLFGELGAKGVIEIPFDLEYAHTEPAEFLDRLCKALPSLRGIVCGEDWSFGYKARGNSETLRALGPEYNIAVTVVPPVLLNGEKISSTRIRNAVSEGNLALSEQLLGRRFSIFGPVVRGRGAGRGLGFPTANIEPLNELIPAPGVYAAFAHIEETESEARTPSETVRRPGAVFIGQRKTFRDTRPVVEVHLPDYDGELYGRNIELELIKKIRDVRTFPSPEDLSAQIQKDVAQVCEICNEKTDNP